MKKLFLTTTIFFVATGAFAFSGLVDGITGHKHHSSGVNSIGVHIDANGDNTTPDITLADCNAYAGTGLMNDTTYAGGYAGLASDGQTQCRCETGSKWSNGACIPSEGASCSSWTTNECGSGYYCQFSPTSCNEDPTAGVCKDISDCTKTEDYHNFWMSSSWNGKCSPDWWTAQSICKSKDMRLVSLADIDCEVSAGICNSQMLEDIRNAGLINDFWTADLTGMSCYCAWNVDEDGSVYNDYGSGCDDYTASALCIK